MLDGDWSSDVCSSDLALKRGNVFGAAGIILKDVRQAPYIGRAIFRMIAGRFGARAKV
jgi:hypothetical protein